jgi:8-oxo-dGTP diphosphatase
VLAHREERALVLRRRPDDRSFAHAWSLPGGRLDPGEGAAEAAVREAREESGLAVALDQDLGPRQVRLTHRPILFVIHRFVGRAEEGMVRLSAEHVDARWLDRAAAAEAASLPGGLAGEVTTELLSAFAEGRLPCSSS